MVDEECDRLFLTDLDAAQSADEKIGVKVLPAKLAIRDGLQPNLLLLGDNPSYGGIFGRAQFIRGDFSRSMLLAELLQLRRAQQAAHLVGAKRRIMRG
jgi:hypothetical protein